jgi:hypothetical protein
MGCALRNPSPPSTAQPKRNLAKEESGSFLKKRTKKRLVLRAVAPPANNPTAIKSFLVLFFKKEPLPSYVPSRGK